MTRIIQVFSLVMLSIFVLSSCDELPDKSAPEDSCDTRGEVLCDESSLKICGPDHRWAYEACETVCTQQGKLFSGTCGPNEELGRDACDCIVECCEEGTQTCDGENLKVCADCVFTVVDCQEFCARYDRPTSGCGTDPIQEIDLCQCRDETEAPCPETFVKCRENPVTICGAQTLPADSCRTQCESLGFHFGYCETNAGQPAEICHCSEEPESTDCAVSLPTCIGDSIAACRDGVLEIIRCEDLCSDLSLDAIGCEADPDRGHDACYCGSVADR